MKHLYKRTERQKLQGMILQKLKLNSTKSFEIIWTLIKFNKIYKVLFFGATRVIIIFKKIYVFIHMNFNSGRKQSSRIIAQVFQIAFLRIPFKDLKQFFQVVFFMVQNYGHCKVKACGLEKPIIFLCLKDF